MIVILDLVGYKCKANCFLLRLSLSYVADPPRGFASYLEKAMKRQWGSRRDTRLSRVAIRQKIVSIPTASAI